MKRAGWTPTQVAAVAGVSESAIRKNLDGTNGMRAESFQRLRKDLPGFANLVDGKAA